MYDELVLYVLNVVWYIYIYIMVVCMDVALGSLYVVWYVYIMVVCMDVSLVFVYVCVF